MAFPKGNPPSNFPRKRKIKTTWFCDECGNKCHVSPREQWQRSKSKCMLCGCHRLMDNFSETTFYKAVSEAKKKIQSPITPNFKQS